MSYQYTVFIYDYKLINTTLMFGLTNFNICGNIEIEKECILPNEDLY